MPDLNELLIDLAQETSKLAVAEETFEEQRQRVHNLIAQAHQNGASRSTLTRLTGYSRPYIYRLTEEA